MNSPTRRENIRDSLSECSRPYLLEHGKNPFLCLATHIDGSQALFEAYWTCPLFERGGGVQSRSVLGRSRQSSVTIRASENHERYHELACWAFDPEASSRGAADIAHDGIGFDYSMIDRW